MSTFFLVFFKKKKEDKFTYICIVARVSRLDPPPIESDINLITDKNWSEEVLKPAKFG